MSDPPINTAIALKLHAFGLTQLHDPNWTGMEMFDHVKQHTRGREDPTDLLRKPLRKGLLFHLGLWLYDDYFFSEIHRLSLGDEYRLWYLEDLVEFLSTAGVPPGDPRLKMARDRVETISALYSEDERRYWDELKADDASDSHDLYGIADELINRYGSELRRLAPDYAENYAGRVFHDRELCEHIGKTLIVIGFDGTPDGTGPPKQWIERLSSWPTWVTAAVVARDRGQCALCGVNIVGELRAAPDLDHIIPLARGGTNDISNLQLLCAHCNNKKSANPINVKSSIPEYLRAAQRKHDKAKS